MANYTHEQAEQSIHLGGLVEQRRQVEVRIDAAVQDSRDMGMTWAQIAIGLETTTQNAWERWGLSPEEKTQRRLLDSGKTAQVAEALPFDDPRFDTMPRPVV